MRFHHKFLLITSLIFGLVVFNACPENNPNPTNPKLGYSNPTSQGPSTYTITYDANGADRGTVPAKQEKQDGKDSIMLAMQEIL